MAKIFTWKACGDQYRDKNWTTLQDKRLASGGFAPLCESCWACNNLVLILKDRYTDERIVLHALRLFACHAADLRPECRERIENLIREFEEAVF